MGLEIPVSDVEKDKKETSIKKKEVKKKAERKETPIQAV